MVERPLLIPVNQVAAIEIRCACGASVTIPLQKEMPRDPQGKTQLEKHPSCLGCGTSLGTAVIALEKSLREFLFSASSFSKQNDKGRSTEEPTGREILLRVDMPGVAGGQESCQTGVTGK